MFEYPAAVGKDFRDCARRVCKELGFDSIGLQGLHADLADSIAPEVQFRSDISRLEKEVIKREARLKGYLIVEDDSGLKVSRLSVLQISEKPSCKNNFCQYHPRWKLEGYAFLAFFLGVG
eukprot:g1613.t1